MSALRRRLAARMAEVGVTLDQDSIKPATGHYRTSPVSDAYRWEAHGEQGGVSRHFRSYDTMTRCAAFGVVVSADREVHAREPRTGPTR